VSIVAIELRRKDGRPSLDGDDGPGGILVNGGCSRSRTRFPVELTDVLAVLELSSVMIDLFPGVSECGVGR
jgi:hypothetical protein